MNNWLYFFFVMVIILPINFFLIVTGKVVIGIILIVMQIPWFINFCSKVESGEIRKFWR